MRTRLSSALLVLAICAMGLPRGQASDLSPAGFRQDRAAEHAYASVIKQHTGEPILVVKYPWNQHARPSVEVRVLAEDEVNDTLIRPQFFKQDIMRGEITTTVYQCEQRSEGVRQKAIFSKNDVDFVAFGTRNSLGKPSVCVACRTTPVVLLPEAKEWLGSLEATIGASKALEEGPQQSRARAAFGLLDAWAINPRMLYLELPADYFSKPCKIRIWFLRGKDIVWTEVADWPGIPEGSS